jgi:hypothetical protein
MRWPAIFNDAFTLEAEAMVGPGTLDAINHLADQSQVTVHDTHSNITSNTHTTPYRTLEMIREFG